MKPDVNMDGWIRQTDSWQPVPISQSHTEPKPARTTRSRRRRPRSEATRNMLEMLRALAQAQDNTFEEHNQRAETQLREHPLKFGHTAESPHVKDGQRPAAGSETGQPPGLMLLRAQILGEEAEDAELRCHYCHRQFRLQEGGASFEGIAACPDCEQRLNRDVVLPAVAKHRPHVYQVCDEASRPDHPKKPTWHRQQRSRTDRHPRSQMQTAGSEKTRAEYANSEKT